MAAAEWARKILDLDFPLESLLLVSLLVRTVSLLEVLVSLLEVLVELLRVAHASWHIQIGLLLLIDVHVLLLLIEVPLLDCIESLVTGLELPSSLCVLESFSCC